MHSFDNCWCSGLFKIDWKHGQLFSVFNNFIIDFYTTDQSNNWEISNNFTIIESFGWSERRDSFYGVNRIIPKPPGRFRIFPKKWIKKFKSKISSQQRVPEKRTIARLKGLVLGFHFDQMSP